MKAWLTKPPVTVRPAAERLLRLLVAATVIVPTLVIAVSAFLAYRHQRAEAQARLGRSIDIVYEHAAKVFETLDLVAGQVDQMLAGLSDQEIRSREGVFKARTEALAARLGQTQFVLVIDASGRALVFSAVFPTAARTVTRSLGPSAIATFAMKSFAISPPVV